MTKNQIYEHVKNVLRGFPVIDVTEVVSMGPASDYAWVQTWYKVYFADKDFVDLYKAALAIQQNDNIAAVCICMGVVASRVCDEYNAMEGEKEPLQDHLKAHPAIALFYCRLVELLHPESWLRPELRSEAVDQCQATLQMKGWKDGESRTKTE